MIPATRWVRELSAHDDPATRALGTGALLPDGEVVLRETDIDRMGLRTLRRWLATNSLQPNHPIALIRDASPGHLVDDEEASDLH